MGTKHYEPLTKYQNSVWKSLKEQTKNASAEIKSKSHVHHFLWFGWDYP